MYGAICSRIVTDVMACGDVAARNGVSAWYQRNQNNGGVTAAGEVISGEKAAYQRVNGIATCIGANNGVTICSVIYQQRRLTSAAASIKAAAKLKINGVSGIINAVARRKS